MDNHKCNPLPVHLRAGGGLAIAACVGVSVANAGGFLQSLQSGGAALVLFLVSAALLCGGLIVCRYLGHLWADGRAGLAGFCLVTLLAVSSFSVATSAVAFLNAANSRISQQSASTSGSQSIQSSIAANHAAIASLQATIDSLDPVRRRTERERKTALIAELNNQNMGLLSMDQSNQRDGIGSPVATSFADMGRLLGVSGDTVRLMLAVLVAVLLDLVPLCLGVVGGFYERRGLVTLEKVAEPVKKPQGTARHLHAV